MANKLERDVKRGIKVYLASIGAYQFMPVQTGYGARSLDILCCIRGRFVGIECKRSGVMTPRPHQALAMAEINKAGGLAFITDSVERAREMIEQHVLGAYDYARD